MLYGPFHRLETTEFQTSEVALLQVASGEIWGGRPRHIYQSEFLVVKAYRGALPKDASGVRERGIEFTTPVPPRRGSGSRYEARWYYPDPGVLLRRNTIGDEFASIPAFVSNYQP